MRRPELSLVIPIYNEEEVLPQLGDRLAELLATLAIDCEVVFVDDGSKDRSLELLRELAAKEPRYRVASFSRNFGHQRAITCGMDLARGKAVVVLPGSRAAVELAVRKILLPELKHMLREIRR